MLSSNAFANSYCDWFKVGWSVGYWNATRESKDLQDCPPTPPNARGSHEAYNCGIEQGKVDGEVAKKIGGAKLPSYEIRSALINRANAFNAEYHAKIEIGYYKDVVTITRIHVGERTLGLVWKGRLSGNRDAVLFTNIEPDTGSVDDTLAQIGFYVCRADDSLCLVTTAGDDKKTTYTVKTAADYIWDALKLWKIPQPDTKNGG